MILDNTLIAGIITSVATLVAAFITIAAVKKANKNLEEDDKYSIFNKTYTVLVRKSDNNTIVIKDGFSWVGVFFHIFWLFYAKLWEVIFMVILVVGIIFIHLYLIDYIGNKHFSEYLINFLKYIPSIVPIILLGMFGNRLLMRKYTHSFCLLDNRKHVPVDSVIATTKTNAILKYMEKHSNG